MVRSTIPLLSIFAISISLNGCKMQNCQSWLNDHVEETKTISSCKDEKVYKSLNEFCSKEEHRTASFHLSAEQCGWRRNTTASCESWLRDHVEETRMIDQCEDEKVYEIFVEHCSKDKSIALYLDAVAERCGWGNGKTFSCENWLKDHSEELNSLSFCKDEKVYENFVEHCSKDKRIAPYLDAVAERCGWGNGITASCENWLKDHVEETKTIRFCKDEKVYKSLVEHCSKDERIASYNISAEHCGWRNGTTAICEGWVRHHMEELNSLSFCKDEKVYEIFVEHCSKDKGIAPYLDDVAKRCGWRNGTTVSCENWLKDNVEETKTIALCKDEKVYKSLVEHCSKDERIASYNISAELCGWRNGTTAICESWLRDHFEELTFCKDEKVYEIFVEHCSKDKKIAPYLDDVAKRCGWRNGTTASCENWLKDHVEETKTIRFCKDEKVYKSLVEHCSKDERIASYNISAEHCGWRNGTTAICEGWVRDHIEELNSLSFCKDEKVYAIFVEHCSKDKRIAPYLDDVAKRCGWRNGTTASCENWLKDHVEETKTIRFCKDEKVYKSLVEHCSKDERIASYNVAAEQCGWRNSTTGSCESWLRDHVEETNTIALCKDEKVYKSLVEHCSKDERGIASYNKTASFDESAEKCGWRCETWLREHVEEANTIALCKDEKVYKSLVEHCSKDERGIASYDQTVSFDESAEKCGWRDSKASNEKSEAWNDTSTAAAAIVAMLV